MVDYIYKNTDEIFATSPSFVEAICNRKRKVPHYKVHYWPQYAEEFYKPMEKTGVEEIPEDDSFKVIFTGNIGTAQGLQILPQTAEILREENVKFVIVGDGRYLDEFEQEIQKRNVENKFIMVARQPAERIPELLAACDAAFLSFQNDELWTKTIPAKLQSYMACGMPIIASAEGETERIIKEAECGVRKPGIAFFGALVTAGVNLLLGSPYGLQLVLAGVLEALGVEIAYAIFKRDASLKCMVLGQILGAVFVFCRDTFFWGTPWSYGTGIAAGVVIVRLLSSVVIGIALVKVITAALVKTGVLKGFVCAK